MYFRIAAVLVIVVFLTATHWKAYSVGKQTVKSELIAAVRKAEEERRTKESALLEQKQRLDEDYATRKKNSDAVIRSSRNELDRLRDELRSYAERQNPDTSTRTDADPRDTIIRECSEAAQSLARVADENGLKLKALQSYVTDICLNQK